jgi:hypothetical protein
MAAQLTTNVRTNVFSDGTVTHTAHFYDENGNLTKTKELDGPSFDEVVASMTPHAPAGHSFVVVEDFPPTVTDETEFEKKRAELQAKAAEQKAEAEKAVVEEAKSPAEQELDKLEADREAFLAQSAAVAAASETDEALPTDFPGYPQLQAVGITTYAQVRAARAAGSIPLIGPETTKLIDEALAEHDGAKPAVTIQ